MFTIRTNCAKKIKFDIFKKHQKNNCSSNKKRSHNIYVKVTYISQLFEIVPHKLNMKYLVLKFLSK